MQDKFQKIYIGTNEGITSVIDCLVNSTSSDILLIIPPENKNFQNIITLKLLKREAKTLGKNLIVISSNPTLKKLVSKIGLRAIDYFQIEEVEPEIFYDKPSEVGKISDIAPPSKRYPAPSPPKKEEIPEEIKEEKLTFFKKLKLRKKEPFFQEGGAESEESKDEEAKGEKEEQIGEEPKKHRVFAWSNFFVYLIVVVGLGVVAFAFVSLPRAKVEITPKTEIVSFDLGINLDKGISEIGLSQRKVPAQLIRIEREAKSSFLSTGKKLKESKARGTITVYNNYSSASQSLVATTRFISENGKLFRTVSSVTIPGANVSGEKVTPSVYDVEVIAAEAGEEYNIGPATFSILGFAGTPKYTGFYGKSSASMSGGFKGEIKFVTKDDIKDALKNLEQQLASFKAELTSKIPQNLELVEGASEFKIETISSPQAGDEKEKFEMNVKGMISALVFNEEDVKKLIEENVASKIVTDKKSLPKTQKIVYSVKSINFGEGKAEISLRAEEGITWKIDAEELKRNLASKSGAEGKEYLGSLLSIDKGTITFWPFWMRKFPSNPEKIEVEIAL